MWKPEVDVLIASNQDPARRAGLLCQVSTILNSCDYSRVTIPVSGQLDVALEVRLPKWPRVRVIEDCPKGPIGYAACQHALETLRDWAPWWMLNGDDDVMLPWAIPSLYAATEGVKMVVAPSLQVERGSHEERTHYKVGYDLTRNHVGGNNVLINTEAMHELSRPWLRDAHDACDFELISMMAERFPYRLIKSTVNVLCLTLGEPALQS